MGEREWCSFLGEFGINATRNRIGVDGDDILHDLDDDVSFEVKRQERITLPRWLEQAEQQAGDRVPVVAFRQNAQPWRCVVPAEHYIELLLAAEGRNDGARGTDVGDGDGPERGDIEL